MVSSIRGRQHRREKREETPKGRVGVRKLGQNHPPPNQRPATEMIWRVWTMLEEPNLMGHSGGTGADKECRDRA